jgi:hypothetical protein
MACGRTESAGDSEQCTEESAMTIHDAVLRLASRIRFGVHEN